MSYQVLARKWRPRSFPEMVGQEHVLRALINALDNDRLHHAFLFTGTRGVGKTTIARILAKSLNCEQGVGSEPCGQCSSCREIDEGRFVDLIEVDAASRTKVEDTRELLENVQYAPSRGRYKVYLIDEVHMLSNHSFNALLKTLEEPPPHVKFLLATTDPQRLPVTILSRCLQFNLKRLPLELITGHLRHLLEEEGTGFDDDGLRELARAADGSMRDALSLLDQAIAFSGAQVVGEKVRAMLGTIDRGRVLRLVEALAARDGSALMSEAAQLDEMAPDYSGVLAELSATLHRVALFQAVPDAVDDAVGDRADIARLAGALAPEDVQLYYQIAVIGRRDLPLAPDPRSGFEMTLLRMLAFHPDSGGPGAGGGRKVSGTPMTGAGAPGQSTSPSAGAVAETSAASVVGAAARKPQSSLSDAPMSPEPSVLQAAPVDELPMADADPVDDLHGDPRIAAVAAVRRLVGATKAASQGTASAPAPSKAHAGSRPVLSVVPSAPQPVPVTEQPTLGEAPRLEPSELQVQWAAMVQALPLNGVTRELAANCTLVGDSDGHLTLVLEQMFEHLRGEQREEGLRGMLEAYLGRPVRLTLEVVADSGATPARLLAQREADRLREAERSIAADPNLHALVEHFSGTVVPGSVRPLAGAQ